MSVHGGPAKWWTKGYDAGRIHVASKGIVQSGLVLNLDSGASTSYPGTGTTWYDLSGGGNHATFSGTPLPTFTPTAGEGYVTYPATGYFGSNAGASAMTFTGYIGSIGFNRNNMITPSSIPITSNALTASVWVKHREIMPGVVQRYLSLGAEVFVLRHQGNAGAGQFHLYGCTGRAGFSGSNTTAGYSGSSTSLKVGYTVSGAISANTFYNFVGTWNGTTAIAYRNGVIIPPPTSGTAATDTWGGVLCNSATAPSLPLYVNCLISSGDEPFNQGYVYNVQIYNRALTQTEITKNYNVMRTRFGV